MRENSFQSKLIKKIRKAYPGCIILKNDPNYLQGIQDLTILWNDKYALLEDKCSKDAEHQPNQDYYVDKVNAMSFSRFIFPENEKQVLKELDDFFNGE